MKPGRTIHSIWVYRWIFCGALLAGLLAWFIWVNSKEVDVKFPFLGSINTTAGTAIFLSAVTGALAMWLYLTVRTSFRNARQARQAAREAARSGSTTPAPTAAPHPPAEARQDVRS